MSSKQVSPLTKSILETVTSSLEQQKHQIAKVQIAQKAATEAYNQAQESNIAKKQLVERSISELRDELKSMLDDENKAAREAYDKTLISLGLKSEDHPFQPIVTKADEAAKATLGVFGKLIKAGEQSLQYVKDGVNATRKA